MAKYKSLVSTLFIYNKICGNVKKLENFEISTYMGEKKFSRVQNFFRGGGGLRTLRLQFSEGGVGCARVRITEFFFFASSSSFLKETLINGC